MPKEENVDAKFFEDALADSQKEKGEEPEKKPDERKVVAVVEEEKVEEEKKEEDKKVEQKQVEKKPEPNPMEEISKQLQAIGQNMANTVEQQQHMTQQMQQLNKPVEQEPELPELDPFDVESVRAHIEVQALKIAEAQTSGLKKEMDERMAVLEGTVYLDKHTQAIKDCKEKYGDRFDYERDKESIAKIRETYPGLAMENAFAMLDYNRVKQDKTIDQEEKEVREDTHVISQKSVNVTPPDEKQQKVPITELEREIATQVFGNAMTLDEYAESKLEGQKEKGKKAWPITR